jgi:hypothetical protein
MRQHQRPSPLLISLLSTLACVACKSPPDTAEPEEPTVPQRPYYPSAGADTPATIPPTGGAAGGSAPPSLPPPPPSAGAEAMTAGAQVGGGEGGGEAGGFEGGYGGGSELGGVTPEGGALAGSDGCDEGALPRCATCDAGATLLVEYDEACETLSCPAESYRLETGLDGVERCLREELEPPLINCYDLDVCVPPEEQQCGVITSEVIAEADACATISGCDDTGAPALEARPNESLCNTWGTCNNGACSAPAVCEAVQRYNNFNRFCQSAVSDGGETTCAFYVDARGASNADAISCDAFCALSGLTCVDGWNDNNGSCNPTNNNRGCDGDLQTQVCVCAVPPAP